MSNLHLRRNFYRVTSFISTLTLLTILFICCIFDYIFTTKLKWKKTGNISNRENATKLLPNENIEIINSETNPVLDEARPRFNGHTVDERLTASGSSSSVRRQRKELREDNLNNSTENPYNNIYMSRDDSRSKQMSEPTYKLVADLKYYYQQYGLDVEHYRLTTKDGFELDLWHIVDSDQIKNKSQQNGTISINDEEEENLASSSNGKNPVLFIHGLLQSSGSFASSGLNSLAYYVKQSLGRDVWLGNNRCGFNPGVRHDPNHAKDDLWDWDLNEMSKYDLPCLTDFVLRKTGKEKIELIGHSQGTMQTLQSLINYKKLDTDYDHSLLGKVENFIALAPAVYPGILIYDNIVLKILAKVINNKFVMGTESFIPLMMFIRNLSITLGNKSIFTDLSYLMFKFLFEWNDRLWDKNLRSRHFLFSPVYVSVKLMRWWLSEKKDAVSFKNGKVSNLYFPDNKIWFPIKTESVQFETDRPLHIHEPKELGEYPKIALFIPKLDKLVDGNRLCNHFTNFEDKRLYNIYYIENYSHLDVLWSMDVIEVIGKRISKILV
ncbi:hypothetical protein ACO0SA_003258 [Hanseniaspora valbyensis]